MFKRNFSLFLSVIFCIFLLITSGSLANNDSLAEKNIVVDCFDREVEVPDSEDIERIGCLFAYSGHAVALLNRGNDIVAIVDGLKRDVLFTEMYPNIKDAIVPSKSSVINIEELARADCDILFVQGENAVNEAYIAQIEQFNIPYLVIDYGSIAEHQFSMEMIGKALGEVEEARQYIDYYNYCIERVQEKMKDIPYSERITVYHSVNEATRTDARGTLAAEWLEIAGAHNVSLDTDLKFLENKYFASLEQILLWDAEVIIVNEENVDKYILTNEQWADLQAVKNERVYKMPNGVSRWGHPTNALETPLAILWVAKLLYPDLFEDINMQEEVKYFYSSFYEWDLTDEYIEKILSGEGMRLRKGDV